MTFHTAGHSESSDLYSCVFRYRREEACKRPQRSLHSQHQPKISRPTPGWLVVSCFHIRRQSENSAFCVGREPYYLPSEVRNPRQDLPGRCYRGNSSPYLLICTLGWQSLCSSLRDLKEGKRPNLKPIGSPTIEEGGCLCLHQSRVVTRPSFSFVCWGSVVVAYADPSPAPSRDHYCAKPSLR